MSTNRDFELTKETPLSRMRIKRILEEPGAPPRPTGGQKQERQEKHTGGQRQERQEKPTGGQLKQERQEKLTGGQQEKPRLPGWIHIDNKYKEAGWETIKLAPRDQTAHLICKRHTLDPNGVPGPRADLHIVRFGPMTSELVNCAVLLGARPVSANIRVSRESNRMFITLEDNEGKKVIV